MTLQCSVVNGVAQTCKIKTPITAPKRLYVTRPGVTWADTTELATESVWLGKLADGTLKYIGEVFSHEVQDFEDPIVESNTGERNDTFEGQRGMLYNILHDLDQHQILRTYTGQLWNLIVIDRNGYARMTLNSDGTIEGIPLSYFKVGKQTSADAENLAYTPVQTQEENPDDWDQSGLYFKPDTWKFMRLGSPTAGVLQTTLTCTAIAAGVFTASVNFVNTANPSGDGSANTKAITGLLAANFKVYDQSGSLLTATTDYTATAVTGSDGDYTIDTTVGTPITGGTCQVIASTTALYNSAVVTLT